MNPMTAVVEKAQRIASDLACSAGSEFSWTRLSDQELVHSVQALSGLGRLIDAAIANASGQIAARCDGEADDSLARKQGERNAVALVGRLTGTPSGEAGRTTRVGSALAPRRSLSGEPLPPAHPHLEAALAAASITLDSAHAILQCLGKVAAELSTQQQLDLEGQLVQTAVTWRFSVEDLVRYLKAVPDHLDPDGAEPRAEALHGQRNAWRKQLDNGLTRFVFDLDPESAAFLNAALDARTAPSRGIRWLDGDGDPTNAASDDAVADDRTRGQRLVDAVVVVAKQALTVDDGEVAGAPVTVVVTGTIDQLTGGLGPVALAGVDQPADAGTLRRLAADAEVIPQILGGRSEVLDQGAGRRFFTRAQRLAMATRDKGCIWPGCKAPPSWCQAAHVHAHGEGGPTDLDNGALMCGFDHRRFDTGGWTMRRDEAGTPWFIPPAHVDATRRPRAGGRPPLPQVG